MPATPLPQIVQDWLSNQNRKAGKPKSKKGSKPEDRRRGRGVPKSQKGKVAIGYNKTKGFIPHLLGKGDAGGPSIIIKGENGTWNLKGGKFVPGPNVKKIGDKSSTNVNVKAAQILKNRKALERRLKRNALAS